MKLVQKIGQCNEGIAIGPAHVRDVEVARPVLVQYPIKVLDVVIEELGDR